MKTNDYTPGPWYGRKASGGQGLIISAANGHSVAVSYRDEDANILAGAHEALDLLKRTEQYMHSLIGQPEQDPELHREIMTLICNMEATVE